MPRVRVRGLVRERRTKDKKVVWYYREGHNQRIRIHGEYGSPEFNAALKAASGHGPALVASAKPSLSYSDPNSFAWLVDQFLNSPTHLVGKADATQSGRKNLLLRVLKRDDGEVGATPYRQIDEKDILSIQRKIATEEGKVPMEDVGKENDAGVVMGKAPMANSVVAVLRVVFKWAVKKELLTRNPCLGVEAFSYAKGTNYVWTDEDMLRFEAFYPLGTRERLAYSLLLYSGQRSNDVKRMGRQHIKHEDGIDWLVTPSQRKTGKAAGVPVMKVLAEAIAAGPTGDLTFVVDENGAPFKDFGKWFRAACDKAGVPDCTPHGLRHAGATRLASRGARASTLIKIYGWSINQADNYVKTAENKRTTLEDIHLLNHVA